jgi:Subtilase family/Fibronectin type-III domain/Peptidase inhibitor I9/PA domain
VSARLHRALAAALGVLVAAGSTAAPPAQAAPSTTLSDAATPTRSTEPGLYVVTLAGRPTAAHRSTRPEPGDRFDRTTPEVGRHQARLLTHQDDVLRAIGRPEVAYRFTTALNGFAAHLDAQQVKRLRSRSDVLLVERSTTRRAASDSTGFLDRAGARGAWEQVGGPAGAGRGVVVGVVDSGIWPENPSFAGLAQAVPGEAGALPGFHGSCAMAERWSPSDCSGKIVSARWFVRGFGSDNLASSETLSPRDAVGHGSHVASVAAGEPDVRVVIDEQPFGRDTGVAPAARLAVYKACWTAPDPADDGCTTADAVAAVDQAVADGVDVLSYSVRGAHDPTDTLSRAFLSASAAGVFVAAAAGNGGPEPGSVGNTGPWVTTVAAGTSRLYQGAVRLPDGTSYVGAMTADRAVPKTRVVLAADAVVPDGDVAAARRCEPGSLDSTVVHDAVVVCDRGVVARVDKSTEVARAGGAGMVLANTSPDSVDADVHAVPTVHLDAGDAAALVAYVRSADADARVALDADARASVPVPTVAPFSSRGPAVGGDLLKPDLTAPGVAVIGAVTPTAGSGRLWDLMSGTSVSTAHVAGLAALVRGARPTWSPARIRSAMTTTAYDVAADPDALAQGAGHVDPRRYLDPGLVVDGGPAAWRAFLRGDRRPQDLNLPSVAVGGLVGRTTVVRRLTSVAAKPETYTASVEGLPGVTATVRPTTVTLAPGQSRRVRIRLVASPDAPVGDFSRGRITWTGVAHQARVPVLVRTSAVVVPGEVGADGSSGALTVSGRSGLGNRVDAVAAGLVPASPVGLTLRPGPIDVASPDVDGDTFATRVTVPTGSEAVRFEVSGRNARDDLDLYLYRDDDLVTAETSPSRDAVVTLDAPAPGDYRVLVHAVEAGNGSTATAQLSSWMVGAGESSPLTVTPGAAPRRAGGAFDYRLSWDDLDTTRRWLGVVRYSGTERRTLVRIN